MCQQESDRSWSVLRSSFYHGCGWLAMAMHLPSWSHLKCSRLTFTRTAIYSFDTDRRRDERGNNHPSSKRCGRGAKQTLKRSARTGSARYAAGNRPLVTGNYIQHERIKWLKKKNPRSCSVYKSHPKCVFRTKKNFKTWHQNQGKKTTHIHKKTTDQHSLWLQI